MKIYQTAWIYICMCLVGYAVVGQQLTDCYPPGRGFPQIFGSRDDPEYGYNNIGGVYCANQTYTFRLTDNETCPYTGVSWYITSNENATILSQDNFKCTVRGASTYTLHVYGYFDRTGGPPADYRFSTERTVTIAPCYAWCNNPPCGSCPTCPPGEPLPPPLCETTHPATGGFAWNSSTGLIEFKLGACATDQVLGCISGSSTAQSGVVATAATTFSANWKPDTYTGDNPVEDGYMGSWRPQNTYAYNTPLTPKDPAAAARATQNYKVGTFSATRFNWKGGNANSWIPATTVTRYSDNGEATEERDVLGNYSCAKFGYGGSVPYLVAQNARYEETLFESFENSYPFLSPPAFEDGVLVQGTRLLNSASLTAHSGRYCLQMSPSGFPLRPLLVRPSLKSQGLWFKVWIRLGDGRLNRDQVQAEANSLQLKLDDNLTLSGLTVVAQVGEWSLCERLIPPVNALTANQIITPTLTYTGSESLYIDDVRLQPAQAQMVCYVYDESLRPVATFDDRHFGMYYQYNMEGKLVRKLIETERGMKTVQETQYNMPKIKNE